LLLVERKVANDEVIVGFLQCVHCKASFAIRNGVPRMVVDLGERRSIAEGWGYEWTKKAQGKLETDTLYGRTEEAEVRSFFRNLGITPDNLPGKLILDAGCGYGRLTKALGRYGAKVFGIDIATSIEYTSQYCLPQENVHIIQADIVALPFRTGTFDYVWSWLAICYVRNPEEAAKKLAEVVKPSGRLSISVPDKTDLAPVVRLRNFLKVSHRLPRGLLFYLCWCAAPLTWLLGVLWRRPTRSLRTRAFSLFNALQPSFMTRHSGEEVKSWFQNEDFADVKCTESRHVVCFRGTKIDPAMVPSHSRLLHTRNESEPTKEMSSVPRQVS
jgi:SAM-dependent methyltransferase